MNRILMVVGAEGMLGRDVQDALKDEFEVLALSHGDLDITDIEAVKRTVRKQKPDIVVNAAAYTDVDGCEEDVDRAHLVNAIGARNLAVAAERYSAELVHISTDYVFDGEREGPYHEFDPVGPTGEYGRSKLAAEALVRDLCRRHYIIRVGVLFGMHRRNFVDAVVERAKRGEDLRVPVGRIGCPTHTWDLACAIGFLVGTERFGTIHFNQGEPLSRADFARRILKVYELGGVTINEVEPSELGEKSIRPTRLDLSMRTWRLEGLPDPRSVEEALAHLKQRQDGNHVTQGTGTVWQDRPRKHEQAHGRARRGAWIPQRQLDDGAQLPADHGESQLDRDRRKEAEAEREREKDRERSIYRGPDSVRGRNSGGGGRGGRRGGGGYRRDDRRGGRGGRGPKGPRKGGPRKGPFKGPPKGPRKD